MKRRLRLQWRPAPRRPHPGSRRAQAADAINEQAWLFRRMVENAPDMIYRYRLLPTRAMEYVSPACIGLLGFTPAEFYAEASLYPQIVHPDDALRMASSMRDGESGPTVLRWLRKDGSLVWVEQRLTAIYDASGRMIAIEGIARDISERKRVEDELRRERDLVRGILEASPDGICITDISGTLLECNSAAVRLTGSAAKGDVVGRESLAFVAPESRGAAEALAQYTREHGALRDAELLLQTVSGTNIPAQISAGLLRDAADQPVGYVTVMQDVTARKQADEALRRSEASFRSVFESAMVGIVLLDANLCARDCNPAAQRMLGYSPAELRGKGALDVTHPDDLAICRDWLARVRARQSDHYELEKRYLRKDGKTIWGHTHVSLVHDFDDTAPFAIAIMEDVTERKEAEAQRDRLVAALSGNEARVRYIIKHNPSAIAVFDKDLRYIMVSDRYLVDYRLGAQDLTGRYHYDVFPEIPEFWREVHRRCMAGEVIAAEDEPFARPDGTTDYVRWECRPWHDDRGDVGGIIIYTEVTTARKQAEAALRESELKFRSIVEQSADGIALLDSKGTVIEWNPAQERLLGLKRAEVVGRPLSHVAGRLFPGELAALARGTGQRMLDFFQNPRPSDTSRVLESKIMHPDGKLRIIQTNICRIDAGPGHHMYASISRDVTVQKQEEEALRLSQKLESVGLLAGGIAHDFNNLLTGMLGQTSLALSKLAPGDPARLHIEKAVCSAERAADLTRQLLAYAGKGQFQIETLDVNRLVRENAALLEALLPKHVRLDLQLLPKPLPVEADGSQVQQVIMNLLINAAEATRQPGGTVRLATKVCEIGPDAAAGHFVPSAEPGPGVYVCIQISDRGSGMDEETLARIFEPFFSTKARGRGLGLAAVLGIIRSCGGGLQVESEPGRGTCFTVCLPLHSAAGQELPPGEYAAEPALPAAGSPSPERGPASAPGGLVLIVDDEPPVREALSDILDTADMPTLLAACGSEAVELLRERRGEIGLIVLDLVMPGMSGEETFRELKAVDPAVRVIVSSGYDEAEALQRLSACNGGERPTAFLQKPYTIKSLLACIRRYLPQR